MEIPVWSIRGTSLEKEGLSTLDYANNSDKNNRSMAEVEVSRRSHLRSTCGRSRNKIKSNNRIRATNQLYSDNSRGQFNVYNQSENNSFNSNCSFNDDCAKRIIQVDSATSVWEIKLRRMFKYHRFSPFNQLWPSVIFILFSLMLISVTEECALGLKTPGRTWPAGDIVLEEGEPLRILCMLNKTYIDAEFPGKNASDLIFFRSNREMEPEFIRIINETTIEMYVEKPPPSKDMYYCKLRLNDEYSKKHEAVCLNNVVVGSKPQEPENFTCVSNNWENMTCTWDPVPNYVETRFTLLFKLPGRAGGRKLYPCPKEKEDEKPFPKNRCYWDTTTNPIYRQPYEYYTFILNAENVLGNVSATYKFHHFAHVIPAKPANLTVVKKISEGVLLHWTVPFPMQNFPPGLHHRVTYQNQWDSRKTWQVINITDDIHMHKRNFNLTGLQYANTLYDVRVFMKSAVAIGEDKWSQFSDVTFRTSPKLPGRPPLTDIGSFEITENVVNRDVYLYWQEIPLNMENGNNFKIQVTHVEENGKRTFLEPNETTRTYAKFKGISYNSYRFELVATNIVGANPEKAVIFIPSRFDIPHEPLAFTKIAFDGGLYELSWKSPITNSEIYNYTIFWCANERDRPYQCTGFLDWKHVSPTTTIYNMTVPDPHKVYQFAISANTRYASSGMVWASCTVIHNKVVGKMKSVWINRIGSDYIEVGWKLDCSDRIGIVEGFNIYYCPIITPYNLNCKGPKLNTTIKADPHTIHGTVTGLKPYTTYMISVAVLTKNGEGLHSDALYNTTMEAAPTPPRNVSVVDVTNSTMLISWEPPIAMNGVLRYYEIHYSGNVNKVEEATHFKLKDLLAYKNYTVHVTACTVSCSTSSPTIYKQTGIGMPGKINRGPIVRFINSSQVSVVWTKPTNAGGKLDYYQISSKDGELQNSTKIETSLPIPDCNTEGRNRMHMFSVRAVNIAPNGQHYYGDWSEPGEGNCYSGGPSSIVLIIIWVIGITGGIAIVSCLFYASNRIWLKCQVMRDVEVKLPPGLADEKLLQKSVEQHIRQSSADSSGCSSGHESVTSSLTSDSHVSADSGAETDPVVSPKLLEPTWESSSLRQRNVGTVKPTTGVADTRWESYVKVSKPGEPEDNLSLARSTPNLTDSAGFIMPQHTWSSTGYISMPSSEELSNHPSPVPKESIGGYSVVGLLPKSNVEGYANLTTNLIKPAPTSAPYVSLASLEPKLAKLIDPPIPKTETTPYVQTGLIDPLGKSKLHAVFPVRKQTSDVMKPYVVVGSLPESTKSTILGQEEKQAGQSSDSGFSVDPVMKPYTLAPSVLRMLQSTDDDSEATIVDDNQPDELIANYGLFWDSKDTLEKRDEPAKVGEVKSSGYVAVTDVPIKGKINIEKNVEKKPGSTDEQYSKVTVAPHNMQSI